MDRDGVAIHKCTEKERGQYSAILTEKAWSCGTHWVVLSGQDGAILPFWVAKNSEGSGSSCPLVGEKRKNLNHSDITSSGITLTYFGEGQNRLPL